MCSGQLDIWTRDSEGFRLRAPWRAPVIVGNRDTSRCVCSAQRSVAEIPHRCQWGLGTEFAVPVVNRHITSSEKIEWLQVLTRYRVIFWKKPMPLYCHSWKLLLTDSIKGFITPYATFVGFLIGTLLLILKTRLQRNVC